MVAFSYFHCLFGRHYRPCVSGLADTTEHASLVSPFDALEEIRVHTHCCQDIHAESKFNTHKLPYGTPVVARGFFLSARCVSENGSSAPKGVGRLETLTSVWNGPCEF